jgi:hypothetical protein
MSNNKQSSVEYLIDKLFDPTSMVKEQLEWFEQAKAMHEHEIKEAFLIPYTGTADEYYEQTYGGDK